MDKTILDIEIMLDYINDSIKSIQGALLDLDAYNRYDEYTAEEVEDEFRDTMIYVWEEAQRIVDEAKSIQAECSNT